MRFCRRPFSKQSIPETRESITAAADKAYETATKAAKSQGEALSKAAEGKAAALLKEAVQAQKESEKLAK